ncbi:putative MFS family arabinose efflux permease [Herbaspirillum sp. Sphag1AN]|jgi:predicted MFS family arabinose efflux permease|uniref:MFS transporter n=1 Tax=unclassified Herbaspirillum TaxID=2624150 RepID=UPI00161B8871|nr:MULTISPECIES: MFS transporter [unclassified Herbaspirillum]MBB3211696.1 putative MFS family arabinose efflux permease [Herbaspirillum sp. Sphag1AN]MBB3245036.1 putative MFS family arabinose efflux permease [Herbaspirillum sp. Sphag64]
MIKIDSWKGRLVLMTAHCAGMLDLVALPVWVGALISYYGLDPQQAGGLATTFLLGTVVSSAIFAPLVLRFQARRMVTIGFALATVWFLVVTQVSSFGAMLLLHALAGMCSGCGLTFTHGMIGRSKNPHRLFATVGIAIGFFGVLFYALAPQLLKHLGGSAMFYLFAFVMAVATLMSALGFPSDAQTEQVSTIPTATHARLDPAVWYVVLGVVCICVVQSMTFSFVERIGIDRGFGFDAVAAVLIALGLVNLIPAPLAALLQRRLSPHTVLLAGPLLQAMLVLVISQSSTFIPYALAASVLVSIQIFTHTFAFGVLAQLDATGRAAASTPATLMIGAAIGPVLGGTLVKSAGYGSLGFAAMLLALMAITCFRQVRQHPDLVPSV